MRREICRRRRSCRRRRRRTPVCDARRSPSSSIAPFVPSVTHSQPVWPVRSFRSARSGSRSPVSAEGTCAEKIGTVDSAISVGVLFGDAIDIARHQGTCADCQSCRGDRGVFVQIVQVEQPRLPMRVAGICSPSSPVC